jgi:hypothetical protein
MNSHNFKKSNEIEELEQEIITYIKSISVKKILSEIFLINTADDDALTLGDSMLDQVFTKEEDLGQYVANILQSNDNNMILETLKDLKNETRANNKLVMNILKKAFILDLLTNLLTKYEEQINIYILCIFIDLMGEADIKVAYFLTPKYISILNLLLKQNSEILSEQILKLFGLLIYRNTLVDMSPDSSNNNELILICETLYSTFGTKHSCFVVILKRMLYSNVKSSRDNTEFIALFMLLLESNDILIKCLYYFELLQENKILQKRADEEDIILTIYQTSEFSDNPAIIISSSLILINTLKGNSPVRELFINNEYYSKMMENLISINANDTVIYFMKTIIQTYDQNSFDNNFVDLFLSVCNHSFLRYVNKINDSVMLLLLSKVFECFANESDVKNLLFYFDCMGPVNWIEKLSIFSKQCREEDQINIIKLINKIT